MHNKYVRSKSHPAGSGDYESHDDDDESEDEEDDSEVTETHGRKPLKVIIPVSKTLSRITEAGLDVPFVKSSPNMSIMLHSPEILPSSASNVFDQSMGK